MSIASYRKGFRKEIEQFAIEMDGVSNTSRRIDLEYDLARPQQIGQLLGFANAADERENLYRQICLARLGKRQLMFNDYWESMEEYEAYMEDWSKKGEEWLVKQYQEMREGVNWLVSNRDTISQGAAEWRLLFRLDSNTEMNLNMMDADPLYIFIRDADLSVRNFSHLAGEVTQG